MAPTRSGIFKHLKFSENDKFTGTNSVDSILVAIHFFGWHFDSSLSVTVLGLGGFQEIIRN